MADEKLPNQAEIARLKRAGAEAKAAGADKDAAVADKALEAEQGFKRGTGGEAPPEPKSSK